ncbi:26S proteasome regulatory subunit 6A [Araneus ventricosus]|uniref:26S proteasome regulatory subunit 6A n=2 Tax=Araneus ventricosus TaxID=182803 RepID=A0A4Y2NRP3_ARAVE|nr:26S proteasome regulatory subunit 6A [Araneus ventricosus]GBN41067.1 26S proteasome regulatory subunit 6A [Araneus ventricosus]
MSTTAAVPMEVNDQDDTVGEEVLRMSTDEVNSRTRLMDNEIKIMKSEVMRISHELQAQKEKIKENNEKIKVNKTLPYLVSNVIELLDVDPQELGEEDGANVDLDSQRKGKCAVIKTSTRQTYFLPVIGLVDAEKLKPADLVGVNKDSYLILETLPQEYDSRVKAMEVDERPTEQYSDIGGLDKQIQELIEAVVLPMTHREKFENLGIQPPKVTPYCTLHSTLAYLFRPTIPTPTLPLSKQDSGSDFVVFAYTKVPPQSHFAFYDPTLQMDFKQVGFPNFSTTTIQFSLDLHIDDQFCSSDCIDCEFLSRVSTHLDNLEKSGNFAFFW